jgi:adenosylcobinamide kinase / adenosylcobinamide-phosphate guanylyltransferase
MPNNTQISLVLGGARSGKSQFAENLAITGNKNRIYLATSQAYDSEMQQRIDQHKTDRGAGWTTVEEQLDICKILVQSCAPDTVILVDCLTLWVTNLMMAEADISKAFVALCTLIPSLNGDVIFVSNEVGQGIVPDNAMARQFRDHAGRLHQQLAACADDVYFITAGLSQRLK